MHDGFWIVLVVYSASISASEVHFSTVGRLALTHSLFSVEIHTDLAHLKVVYVRAAMHRADSE